MKVDFFATLRRIVGTKTVEFEMPEGTNVSQLVDEIVSKYPELRAELLDDKGQLYRHVHVFVNGRDVPYIEDKLETVLKPDDVISVFPAVAGG